MMYIVFDGELGQAGCWSNSVQKGTYFNVPPNNLSSNIIVNKQM